MEIGGFTVWEWLVLVQYELLLFAGIFFLIGAFDDLALDLVWLWLRLTGRARTARLDKDDDQDGLPELSGEAAVFVAAWREAAIIGPTVRHLLAAWPHSGLRLYVGCYRNDIATLAAITAAARGDPRLRCVVHDADGPTTKADCLNRLYRALAADEARRGQTVRMVVMHDAEDMVDPAALGVLDRAIADAEMVQLPVLPEAQRASRWIGSHYCEEFAETHGKALVVRDALRAGVPLAGVGCAIRRDALARLVQSRSAEGPFAAECLTEDYELGIGLAALGGRTRFLRVRTADGRLVATRACFPSRLESAVRQKTRWLHGIAFQGWDRLGWRAHPADAWMRLRDRRGPLTALVLAIAYLLLIVSTAIWLAGLAGLGAPPAVTPLLVTVLAINLASLLWRAAMRFAFTAREYDVGEGLRAVLRVPLANIIAIMAARRALFAYARTLRGRPVWWDKTEHDAHPAAMQLAGAAT